MWAHMAACAALVLRCERGVAPREVRAALLQQWTRPANTIVSVSASSAPLAAASAALIVSPAEFYVNDAAPGLAAVLQSWACTDVSAAQQVLWHRVALACSAQPASNDDRRKRLLLTDSDESLCRAVALAVRLSPPPAGYPTVCAYAPNVGKSDRELLQKSADAVCQVVANWLACPVTAAGRNQWIGFQRVVLSMARALVSPIRDPRDKALPRWDADAFATYRLTVAVAQLSQMCTVQEMATLQLAHRCLYFFGVTIHYALAMLAASAATDRVALLPFWRAVVRYGGAMAMCLLRDLVAAVARDLRHVFEVDWYLERDKCGSTRLASAADAAIAASTSVGTCSTFVINTRSSAIAPIDLPATKHWHADAPSDDPFELLRFVAGMLEQFGKLRDEQVADTLSELATDLQLLLDLRHPALQVAHGRLEQAQRAATQGAMCARGIA
jgi:hypothetical protein